MSVQQIKHNNDGKFYHIAIDIAKEGAQLFDLTPYVKGRVGDNNFGLLVDWYRQGMLMNVNGAYKPVIDGLVGNFSFDKNGNLKMDDDASPVYSEGKPEDCGPAGQVTYYFPEQMFPKEGIFKGYLGLIDDKGNRYSGVDIWFSVLAGNARMGVACDFYISELEKAIATAEDDLKTSKKSMQDVVDEFVSKMNDLTNRLETQANTNQAALDALEAKIKQDGLFTQAEADAFKQAITKQLNDFVDNAKKMLTTADHHLNYHAMSVSLSPTMAVDTNELNHLKYMQAQITVCDMVNIQSATDDNPQLGDKQRLTQFLDEFKSAGLEVVMIKPHLGINWEDSFNRSDYDPTDYNAFFTNWERILMYYADICKQYQIPTLCIGCEQAKQLNLNNLVVGN